MTEEPEPIADITSYPFGERIAFLRSGAVYWRTRMPGQFITDDEEPITMEPYLSRAEHHTAELLARFTRISADIQARPDVGPYEVGVLQNLMELAGRLADVAPEQPRYHYHGPRPGRAVDVMPPSLLDRWMSK